MAVTYGSTNLGSSGNGAFAIYSASTTGAEAVSVLQANFTTNVVSAVSSAVPLTALQTAALSTLLAKLRAAVPSASTLSVLRKLVGVLSMTDGVSLTLSVSSVGSVHTLRATTSAAGSVLVYVPNAAASGLYSGSNSDSGDAPSGAAGGVLGYTGSTYPNPNGLAPISGVIPVKSDGDGGSITIKPDAESGGTGCDLIQSGADGDIGGAARLVGGNGSDGAGGDAIVDAGSGTTTAGIARVGTSNALATYIGRRLTETRLSGLMRLLPTTLALSANGQNVPAERSCVQLLSSAAFTGLGVAAPTYDGQMMLIINASESIQTFATGAGTNLRLGAATRALNNNGTLLLVGVNSRWNEVAFTAG